MEQEIRFCNTSDGVRIGGNTGEPVAEQGDLSGTRVQLAARRFGSAEPGSILISSVVRDLSAGKGMEFIARRRRSFKGFPEPVEVFEVAGG